jgi:hypothetical protein
MDRRDGLGFVGRSISVAHAHATEPQNRDDQTLVAELSLLHLLPPHIVYMLSSRIPQMSIDHVTLGLTHHS